MKLLKALSATIIALSVSTAVMAEVDSQHAVGLQIGGGGLEYKGESRIYITTTSLCLNIT